MFNRNKRKLIGGMGAAPVITKTPHRNYAYSDGWQHNLLGFSCISPTSLFSNPIPVSIELKAGFERERDTKVAHYSPSVQPPCTAPTTALHPPASEGTLGTAEQEFVFPEDPALHLQHQWCQKRCCSWAFLCISVYSCLNGTKILHWYSW